MKWQKIHPPLTGRVGGISKVTIALQQLPVTGLSIPSTFPTLHTGWYPHPANNDHGNLSLNKVGTFTH